jgi:serine/threonine protein kinase
VRIHSSYSPSEIEVNSLTRALHVTESTKLDVVGTDWYLAPEVLLARRNQNHAHLNDGSIPVGSKNDIWAVG